MLTNAGLSTTITTTQSGAAEVLTPAQLGQIVPAIGVSTTGSPTVITASAKAGKWVAAGTVETGTSGALAVNQTKLAPPGPVATVAREGLKVCKRVAKHAKGAKAKRHSKAKKICRTVTKTAARALELPTKYGQKVTIAGTLTNSATGTMIPDGTVTIYATNIATDVMKMAGTTTTNANGQYSYKLAAGSDRRIDIVYGGTTGQTQGSDAAFETTSNGKVRIRSLKVVVAGRKMKVTGRLYGGSIGTKGAIVQLYYTIPGHLRGWAPFKPGRSKVNGRFTIEYPVQSGAAGLTYRVRVRVPDQSGWGYRTTTSNTVAFHVS